ncbi:MAG: lipid-binding SYLF domain-containing protein [Pseudomonadales bacterium]
MKRLTILLTALLLVLLVGCTGQPINKESLGASDYMAATNAIAEFKANEKLVQYFNNAVAFAVFPRVVRAGAGYGMAYGRGWVFHDGESPTGKMTVWQISAGPHIGAQYYRQILFFKTEKSLSRFKRGTMEFAGQVNLTVATASISATPSYNNDVAVFTDVKGGLMVEGSIGGHQYNYRSVQ